ncbi:MAG: class I SAM-dependent methyltransferase [Candidatus Schekmanbacteria bacterium]|nr:class I SAM-dependent methyltransferase [Candidatus Schekmanbacteria bacterium]
MGRLLDIINPLHRSTSRDYLARMMDRKAECMRVARQYGRDFWDGERRYGYGGYAYDGRWLAVAEQLAAQFELRDDAAVLDVGCGKGFLLYELSRVLPRARLCGFDVSPYALAAAKTEIRRSLFAHRAQDPFPFANQQFDLVISITTLHNLQVFDLAQAFSEIDRVGKNGFITVESFRTEQELFNLQCWALTCESFYTPEAWVWLMNHFGYRGDYEFIYFE